MDILNLDAPASTLSTSTALALCLGALGALGALALCFYASHFATYHSDSSDISDASDTSASPAAAITSLNTQVPINGFLYRFQLGFNACKRFLCNRLLMQQQTKCYNLDNRGRKQADRTRRV